MSCWVVPSVAAELWGVSLNQIVARMSAGTIPTRQDEGWTFVDVAPDSPRMEAGPVITPPTYTILTPEETDALKLDTEATPIGESNYSAAKDEADAEETHQDDAESPDLTWQNWHRVRQEVGRTRRRPPLAA